MASLMAGVCMMVGVMTAFWAIPISGGIASALALSVRNPPHQKSASSQASRKRQASQSAIKASHGSINVAILAAANS